MTFVVQSTSSVLRHAEQCLGQELFTVEKANARKSIDDYSWQLYQFVT